MDKQQRPITITLSIWQGLGYFLELEYTGTGVYSLYYVPESKLDKVLAVLSDSVDNLTPMLGDKVLQKDAKNKGKGKKEPPAK